MAYIGNSPENIQRGRRNVYEFKATAGQTAFSGTDLNNQTLDLLEENEMGVYLNGVRLADSDDYTVSGDTLTLLSAASLNDQLTVETQAEIANISSYTRAEADARYINYDGDIVAGDLQISGEVDAGSLIVDTNTLVVDATNNRVGINVANPSKEFQIGNLLGIYDDAVNDTTVVAAESGKNLELRARSNQIVKFYSGGSLAGILDSDQSLNLTNTQGLATLNTKSNALNIGNLSGAHLAFDPNEIQARSDTSANDLLLQKNGGNVGIGDASPSYKMDVYGPVASRGSGVGNAAFVLQEVGNNPWHLLQFTGGAFSINYNTTSSAASTLLIDTSGNVGIGHTSPDEKLDVKGNFTLRDTTGNLSHGMSVFGDNDQYAIFNQEVSGDGGLRITTLSDASSAASAFQLNAVATTPSTDGNNAAIRLRAAKKNGTTEQALASTEDVLSIGNTGTELVVVKGSGNVGINTNDPSNLLELEKDVTTQHSTSANLSNTANNPINFVRLTNSNTSITTPEVNLLFSAGGSGSGQHSIGVTRTGTNSGDMIFRRRTASASSGESMRISNDGDIGIGTSSPTNKLHIIDNGITGSSRSGIKVSKTITDMNNSDFQRGISSEVINNDNTTLTGDREIVGLRLDVTNNGTGGDTSNEMRPYGIYSLVTDNGDADLVYGGFFRSLSNISSGTTSSLYGLEGLAEADNSSGGTITTAYGVRGQTYIDNAGSSVNTAYGLYGRVYQYADGGDINSTATAVYGEVEMNNSSSGGVVGNTFVFQAQVDNNTGRSNVFGSNVYMYYGNYAGTESGTIYGVYIADTFASNYFAGSVSKGSGSFRIPHPKPELTDTKDLVHSFVEGPQADNLYRGRVTLVDGSATVNIDTVSTMTEGTFVLLNRDVQCFTTNETGWTNIRGSVSGNILTIEAQDNTCTDTISWMVIGERQDQHMYDTNWTDSDGKVIVEPDKMVHPTFPEDE